MGHNVVWVHAHGAEQTGVIEGGLVLIVRAEWIPRLSSRKDAFCRIDVGEVDADAHRGTREDAVVHFFLQLELVLAQGIFGRTQAKGPNAEPRAQNRDIRHGVFVGDGVQSLILPMASVLAKGGFKIRKRCEKGSRDDVPG